MPPDELCPTCRRRIVPSDGAAFVDGHIVHVPCYVGDGDQAHDGAGSRDILVGVHVLVVEDSDATREMLQAALEYCGAFVSTASCAREAKAIVREVRPHVIVSDVAMPDNGFDVVRDVLAFAVETGLMIPAVAITEARVARDHVKDAGFSAFITKPLDPLMLAVVVERLARARPS
jgi:CheY-like chemotaxis protein